MSVINTTTGRQINIDGVTYKKLIKDGYHKRGDKLYPPKSEQKVSPSRKQSTKKVFSKLYLVVLVRYIPLTEQQVRLLADPLVRAIIRNDNNNGTQGVKIGLYSTKAKAEQAVYLVQEYLKQNNDDYFELLVDEFKIEATQRLTMIEPTWHGKEVLYQIGPFMNNFVKDNGEKLEKISDKAGYLLVEPIYYHGVEGSRLMELGVFLDPKLALEVAEKLGSHFQVMGLPIDQVPQSKGNYSYQNQSKYFLIK